MNKIIFMVGNIGSGKSTYIRAKLYDREVLCKDELRRGFAEMVGEEYIWQPNLEDIIHDMSLDAIEGMMIIGVENIVLDETNMVSKYRAPYISLAKKYGYICEAVVFNSRGREEHLDARMTKPMGFNREYWGKVYDKMEESYDAPTLEEGFDIVTPYSWS